MTTHASLQSRSRSRAHRAEDGAVRGDRGGGQPLPAPALPGLHLSLRGLWSSPTTSVSELLTEGEKKGGGDLSRGMDPMKMPRTTKDPAEKDPASTQARCGDTRHAPRAVSSSSKHLQGLVRTDATDTQEPCVSKGRSTGFNCNACGL